MWILTRLSQPLRYAGAAFSFVSSEHCAPGDHDVTCWRLDGEAPGEDCSRFVNGSLRLLRRFKPSVFSSAGGGRIWNEIEEHGPIEAHLRKEIDLAPDAIDLGMGRLQGRVRPLLVIVSEALRLDRHEVVQRRWPFEPAGFRQLERRKVAVHSRMGAGISFAPLIHGRGQQSRIVEGQSAEDDICVAVESRHQAPMGDFRNRPPDFRVNLQRLEKPLDHERCAEEPPNRNILPALRRDFGQIHRVV